MEVLEAEEQYTCKSNKFVKILNQAKRLTLYHQLTSHVGAVWQCAFQHFKQLISSVPIQRLQRRYWDSLHVIWHKDKLVPL